MASTIARTPHPYYPRDLILDHYVPNTNSTLETLLSVLVAFSSIVLLTIIAVYRKRHSTLSNRTDQLAFFWFTLCGCVHTMFEGYYTIHHATLAADMSPVGQAWKEYAMCDSRYLSSDNFVWSLELITSLVMGPLSFYCAWSLYHDLPSRYIIQLSVSLAHLYGSVLYFCTSILKGSPECNPDPYYYYFYFWFFNLSWTIVPILLMASSIKNMSRAMGFHDEFYSGESK